MAKKETLQSRLAKLAAGMETVKGGNTQSRIKFDGVDAETAVEVAGRLVEEHGFILNENAVTKAGLSPRTGQPIVTVQVQKRSNTGSCVLTAWGKGSLHIVGQLPESFEHGLDAYAA